MASIDKVILIGNLGRPPRLSCEMREAIDRFYSAITGVWEAVAQSTGFQKVCQMLRLLKASRMSPSAAIYSLPRLRQFVRATAFFNVRKVDGRNLP